MDLARRTADRVLFFAEGLVAESGTPEELFSAPKTERVRDFLRRVKA
jgi:ABC-type histidine transport system ATPase subunit